MGFVGIGKGKLRNDINGGNEVSFNSVFKPDNGVYLEKVSGRLKCTPLSRPPFNDLKILFVTSFLC